MFAPQTTRAVTPRRAGLTLIETVLAMAIGVLVIALIYSSYHTAMAVLSGQTARRQGSTAATHAVQELARDLACGLPPDTAEPCAFQLSSKSTTSSGSELSFCSAARDEQEADLQWFEARHMVFRVAPGARGAGTLLSENRPITGPGADAPPVTNVLLRGVKGFVVEAFDGETWHGEWPLEDSAPWPRACRIALSLQGEEETKPYSTTVFIPVANVITSRLERAATVSD